jgi:hypothetical protein
VAKELAIIPKTYKEIFENAVPSNLTDRVFYIEHDCKDIWEWSDKVYDFACNANLGYSHK